jgi:hypothetical protein
MKWRAGIAVRDGLMLLAWGALGFGGVVFWKGAQTSRPEKPNLAHGVDAAERKGPTEVFAGASVRKAANGHAAARFVAAVDSTANAVRSAPAADLTATDNPGGIEDATLTADGTSTASPDPSPDSIRTLAETLTTDPDNHHRVRAITELGTLIAQGAAQGQEVSTVRDTLRLASADDDADVAERAKDAYDDLIQTLD